MGKWLDEKKAELKKAPWLKKALIGAAIAIPAAVAAVAAIVAGFGNGSTIASDREGKKPGVRGERVKSGTAVPPARTAKALDKKVDEIYKSL